jgi:hypothetical protein
VTFNQYSKMRIMRLVDCMETGHHLPRGVNQSRNLVVLDLLS